mgnify:CR=1 FL=1
MAIISNGTTIADAGAFSVSLGSMVLIKTITVSSNTATVTFLHGSSSVVFNNTYPIYLVKIINSHNDTDDKTLRYNFTTDGTNYNVTKTTTSFRASNYEAGGGDGEEDFIDFFADVGFIDESPVLLLLLPVFTVILLLLLFLRCLYNFKDTKHSSNCIIYVLNNIGI